MVPWISIGMLLLVISLAISPVMILWLRPWRAGDGFWGNLTRILKGYWPHLGLFGVIYVTKNYVDTLNDPIRGVFGDFTFLLHTLEGDAVLWIQNAVQHPWLTGVLNVNYLLGYIFLTYFSFILAAYADDRPLANRMVLNVLVVYLLSIPFYVFFNVQVTSAYIPGMESLLYQSSSAYLSFFAAVDPLDNAWPSLHMGIPFGFLVLLWWRMRRTGHTLATFPYRRYLALVAIELAIFAFSILYLGIHWILDIPGGLLIGYLGAIIVDEIEPAVFGTIHEARRRGRGVLAEARAWIEQGRSS